MTTQTLLLIILAGIVALAVSVFQYFYKGTSYKKRNMLFSLLRFFSIFSLLLLIIDPQFERTAYETVKPVLAVGVDNSASINYLDQDSLVREIVEELRTDDALTERFDLDFYQFGSAVSPLDELSFSEGQSNIAKPLQSFSSVYKSQYIPLLVTDGNATLGPDYEYTTSTSSPSFFLVAGDTTTYEDVKIDRINVNRYAYLNNEFPVELLASYDGASSRSSQLQVFRGEQKLFTKELQFTEDAGGQVVNFYLPADQVGIRQYSAQLTALEGEKNTINNTKKFAVEVIDQKADVAIVYSYLHPDIGAFKKAIEGNELREVELFNITDFSKDPQAIAAYDLIIIYEPTAAFSSLYQVLEDENKNRFTVAATETDFSFLSSSQQFISRNNTLQEDEVQARLNSNFSAFLVEDLDFNDFPPLEAPFGATVLNGNVDVLLYKKIGLVETEEPLLAVSELEGRREVVLLGTAIWQWRAQSYRNNQSFESFDNFIDKLVQYVVSTDRKQRLQLDYKSFYYGSEDLKIRAQYVDDNYNFDSRAALSIRITNSAGKRIAEAPMVLRSNYYEASFNNLEPDEYNFEVAVTNNNLAESGKFTIIAYDIERQAQNANWSKLERTAQKSAGLSVTLNNRQVMIDSLLSDKRFTPVQKSVTDTVSLIDFKVLLFILVSFLAIEWFVRKYNGLI